MAVQEPQNTPQSQGPVTKEEYSIRYVDGDLVYSEHHFDIEGIPVSPPYRVKNPDAIPIQKVGAAPTNPNQSLGLPDGVLTEPVTKTNQPKPAKPKEPIKTQPGLASQVLKGIGSFAWDALDLTNGVAKGIIASITYGAASGALPHSTDTAVNRTGQVIGTAIVEVVGAFLATAGSGTTGGGLIATATGAGALVGIPAVVVGAAINTAGAVLIGGATVNAGRLYNAPPPQYMMSQAQNSGGGQGSSGGSSGSGSSGGPKVGLTIDEVKSLPTLDGEEGALTIQRISKKRPDIDRIEIKVKNRDQADAIRKKLFSDQGYKNSSGATGNQVTNLPQEFPAGKRGTYHWDYGDTQHGGTPHLQIHTMDKKIVKIYWEPSPNSGEGVPITGYKSADLEALRRVREIQWQGQKPGKQK